MNFMCLDFINTQWTITHPPFKDRLLDKDWLDEFLKKYDLPAHADPLTEQETQSLLDLRTVLSSAVDTLDSGQELSDEQLGTINRYVGLTTLYYEFKKENGKYKARLQPAVSGWNYILHALAVSFMKVLSEYDVLRVKKCGNPACGWVLYDESKNTTRRWCSNTCSSLIKVRRFRTRQKSRTKEQGS
ncbi:MAG: zf-CGNR multi-domain protein [Desulfobacteraceae bacterium]|nr:MAG: zf-CGNR multi-domain protein [Desulfobacteraceae bacterium]